MYKVRGSDAAGQVEVFRRFSNFFELREVLYTRFLGLYVPPISEKKSVVSILIKAINVSGKQR